MQSGDYDAALDMFDALLETLPEDPVTLTSRGHALAGRTKRLSTLTGER